MGIFSSVFSVKTHVDPVCGMKAGGFIYSEYLGQKYFFCSENCKKDFETDPSRYAK